MVNATIERHLAMVYENQIDSYLPCHNGTTKNTHTHWRRKGTSIPPQALPPPPPGVPCVPPCNNADVEISGINGELLGYVYLHTPTPNGRCINLDVSAKDR